MEHSLLKFVYDATGESYKTPIACINEPISFGEDKEAKNAPDITAIPEWGW